MHIADIGPAAMRPLNGLPRHRDIAENTGIVELGFAERYAQVLQGGDEGGMVKRPVIGFDIESVAIHAR